MNQTPQHGEDVALFIDWENFKISLASGHRTPNVSALKEEVSNIGRVVVAKAYADWVTRAPELRGAGQFINDPPALYAAGIEPVYVPTRLASPNSSGSGPARTSRVKNSVDVKMTADCIECAHAYPNIGTYVLVSGDSDFIHVINTLRTMGNHVIIIGVSWSTSRRLADQVDGLILYDADIDPITPPEPAPTGNGRDASRPGTSSRVELPAVIKAIEEIVREERRAGGTPLLTSIKQRLMRRYPGFDEKMVGFSGFKKLMVRVEQEGNVKLVTAGLVDWATMADEPTPEEATMDAPGFGVGATVGAGRRRYQPATARSSQAHPEHAGAAQEEALGSAVTPQAGGGQDLAIGQNEVAGQDTAARDLGAIVADSVAALALPEGPGDGLDTQRVADLIVMANTLELQEGVSHVAFTFLATEVSKALESGLEAGQEEIFLHWGQAHSNTYVSRMLRSLGNGNLFKQGWHSWRDEDTGRSRRRRTFNLDHSHPLVAKVLNAHLEAATDTSAAPIAEPADEPATLMEDAIPSIEPVPEAPLPGNEAGRPESSFISRLFRSRR